MIFKILSKLSKLIVVGEIISIEKHPDADRLNVCQVNVGLENTFKLFAVLQMQELELKYLVL